MWVECSFLRYALNDYPFCVSSRALRKGGHGQYLYGAVSESVCISEARTI